MSYILPPEKQLTIIGLLCEGMSINGVSRQTGRHRGTICRLLVRFGTACLRFLDRELRDLELGHLEIDEMWTFVRKKKKNVRGWSLTPTASANSIYSLHWTKKPA